jgi:hypothetical protein
MDERRPSARDPEDLARLFNQRANAGDIEGLIALYEPEATLAVGDVVAVGHTQIREFLTNLLARRKEFPMPDLLPAIRTGPLALTLARSSDGNLSVEVARLQGDGAWLWLIDQLSVPRPAPRAPS